MTEYYIMMILLAVFLFMPFVLVYMAIEHLRITIK